jgi:preprotein translocase subunit SecG
MFITALIAVVALIMMLYLSIRMFLQHRKDTKFGVINKYSNNILDYKLFHTRMIQDFIMNLAIVFAFFNFLSTIIVLGY